MDLKSSLKSKRGTAIKVNGTVYEIDGDGIAHDVSKEDAEKLLTNPNWSVADGHVEKPKSKPKPELEPEIEEDDSGDEGFDEDDDMLPDESWTVKELKDKADVLGLTYRANVSKSKLIDLILDAMGA